MKKQLQIKRTWLVSLIMMILFASCCGVQMTKLSEQKKTVTSETIYVYPVHINPINKAEVYDTLLAKKMVAFINTQPGCKAVFVNRTPKTNAEWGINEAKMFRKSYNAFSDFIATDLKEGKYGMLVEFLETPHEIDVHYYVANKISKKATMLCLVNSHHPIYKKINPKNEEDAFQLFCELFEQHVKHLTEGK